MLAQEPIHIASVAVSEPVDSMQTQSLEVDDSSDQGPVSRNTGSDKSRNVRQDWESLFREGWLIFSTWLGVHQQARKIGAAGDFESKQLKAKAMWSWTENTQFMPSLVDSDSSDEAPERSDGEYMQARIPLSRGQVHIPGHGVCPVCGMDAHGITIVCVGVQSNALVFRMFYEHDNAACSDTVTGTELGSGRWTAVTNGYWDHSSDID